MAIKFGTGTGNVASAVLFRDWDQSFVDIEESKRKSTEIVREMAETLETMQMNNRVAQKEFVKMKVEMTRVKKTIKEDFDNTTHDFEFLIMQVKLDNFELAMDL